MAWMDRTELGDVRTCHRYQSCKLLLDLNDEFCFFRGIANVLPFDLLMGQSLGNVSQGIGKL
jgi:hypothetical protein